MTRASCPETPDVTLPAKHGIYNDISAKHAFTIVSGICLAFNLLLAVRLNVKHMCNYAVPVEQRQIIRIVVMLPVFGAASLFMILSYHYAEYIKPFPDLYEGFAMAAFFLLMVSYVTHEEDETKRLAIFENTTRDAGKGKTVSAAGLYRKCMFAVFQYCFVEGILVIVELITTARGTFCEASNSPKFAHIWVQVIHAVSVVGAIVGLLKFYKGMKPKIVDRGTLSKFLALKLAVFVTVVQGMLFNALIDGDHLKVSDKLSYGDISIGIPATLISIEMALFTIWFSISYSPKEYLRSPSEFPGVSYKASRGFGYAFMDSLNPRDLFKCIALIFKYGACCGGRRKNGGASKSINSEESLQLSPTAYDPHGQGHEMHSTARIGGPAPPAVYDPTARESVATSAGQYGYNHDLERGSNNASPQPPPLPIPDPSNGPYSTLPGENSSAPPYVAPYQPYRG